MTGFQEIIPLFLSIHWQVWDATNQSIIHENMWMLCYAQISGQAAKVTVASVVGCVRSKRQNKDVTGVCWKKIMFDQKWCKKTTQLHMEAYKKRNA